MPKGWYPRDGKLYDLTLNVGKALNSLDDDFKFNWRIKVTNGKINIPNAFDNDMKGYFERPIDEDKRQVGSVQEDAIRNIKGVVTTGVRKIDAPRDNTSGAFKINETGVWSGAYIDDHLNTRTYQDNDFDASRVVPTADENRQKNVGMTLAIYLGI